MPPGRPAAAIAGVMTLTLSSQNNIYLIDTGAEISVFPYKGSSHPSNSVLQAANGSKIATFGTKIIPLFVNGKKYDWTFTLANVKRPLLGADFLRAHDFLVDVKRNCLVHFPTMTRIPLRTDRFPSPSLSVCTDQNNSWVNLLTRFPSITKPEFKGEVKHSVRHQIFTKGYPPASRPRRLSPANLVAAKKAFSDLLKLGIVERSASPYQSPLC